MRSPEQTAREEKPVVGTEQERETIAHQEGSGVRERPRAPEKQETEEQHVQKFLKDSSTYGLKAKMLADELTELQRKTLVVARDPETGKVIDKVRVMTADTITQYRNDLQALDKWFANMTSYAEHIEGQLTPQKRDQVKYMVEQNETIRERITEALETSRKPKSRRRVSGEELAEEPREAAFVSKETQEERVLPRERVSPWAPPKEKPKSKGIWGRIKGWFK